MKKIFSFLLALLAISAVKAQTATITPSVFSPVDPITIRINVTGVSVLEGESPLYIWAWIPGVGDSPTNGSWNNSGEANRLTEVSPGVWEISFIPVNFYGRTAADIKQIGFLAKAKDGTGDKKTKDFVFDVTPITFNPTIGGTFPNLVQQNDIVNIMYNQKLDTAAASTTKDLMEPFVFIEYQLEGSASRVTYAPFNDVPNRPELKMRKLRDKVFIFPFIPEKFFNLQPGERISRIFFKFRGADAAAVIPAGFDTYSVGIIHP